MNLSELAELMIEHGLVIRAIPYEKISILAVRHKDKHPDSVVKYSERLKRDVLQVTTKNSQGGKFIIESSNNQDSTVRWGKGVIFYDTIQQAVESFVKSLTNSYHARMLTKNSTKYNVSMEKVRVISTPYLAVINMNTVYQAFAGKMQQSNAHTTSRRGVP